MEMTVKTEAPYVTVVVCTRDRPSFLEQCLRSLAQQTFAAFEVLVVDNAPERPVREICRRWSADWVPAPVPGLTRARNIGMRAARGAFVAYIDDDAICEPGWLDALVEDFSDPRVAAISGRIRYMKALGDTRAVSKEEATDAGARPRAAFDRETRNWFALACFGGVGDGGNMIFRREALIAAGGFEERLGRGCKIDCGDEHVVFAALIAKGYRLTHRPDAVVRHPSPPTAALQQARRLQDLRMSVAYLMFLWGEFPAHRAAIAGFLCRAVGKRLPPRATRQSVTARLPRIPLLCAMFSGLIVYAGARREWATGRAHKTDEFVAPLSTPIETTAQPR